jgi:hypothetical protein
VGGVLRRKKALECSKLPNERSPEVDYNRRSQGTCGARSVTLGMEVLRGENPLERSKLPNVEVPKSIRAIKISEDTRRQIVNFRDFPLRRIHAVVVLAPVVLASGHSPWSYASIDGWKNLKNLGEATCQL